MGADLDTPSRIAQHLFASGEGWDRYQIAPQENETVYRCGSNANGLLGVPFTRISKYNMGEP